MILPLAWNRHVFCWGLAVLVGLTNSHPAHAISVLDQASLPPSGLPSIAVGSGIFTFIERAQTFAVGTSGKLDRIELSLSSDEGPVTELDFSLYPTAGGVPVTAPGAALFTTQIPIASPKTFSFENPLNTSIDLSAANIQVEPGLQLAWALARSDANTPSIFTLGGNSNYLGGQAFERTSTSNLWTASSGNASDQYFRTFVDTDVTSGTTTIDVEVMARVALEDGVYVLNEDPDFMVTQQILHFDIDRRAALEFPLDSLPENIRITGASLDLNINLLSSSAGEGPTVPVFGYQGDGAASLEDASVTTNLLASIGPIFDTGPIRVELQPEFISELLGTGSHLGLAFIGSANGNQLGIDGFSELPELTLEYEFLSRGDFDQDGDVDGTDFLKWQRDSTVGAFDDWHNDFGEGGSAETLAATATVPEPASSALIGMHALLLALRFRMQTQLEASHQTAN